MEEEWKDIIGYEELYKINIHGEVIRNDGLVVKQTLGNRGYYLIKLNREGSRKSFLLHRLIAIHFLENPENRQEFTIEIDGEFSRIPVRELCQVPNNIGNFDFELKLTKYAILDKTDRLYRR